MLDTMEFGQNDIFGRIREFCVTSNDCALTCFQQCPKVSLQVATGVPEGTESGALPKRLNAQLRVFLTKKVVKGVRGMLPRIRSDQDRLLNGR